MNPLCVFLAFPLGLHKLVLDSSPEWLLLEQGKSVHPGLPAHRGLGLGSRGSRNGLRPLSCEPIGIILNLPGECDTIGTFWLRRGTLLSLLLQRSPEPHINQRPCHWFYFVGVALDIVAKMWGRRSRRERPFSCLLHTIAECHVWAHLDKEKGQARGSHLADRLQHPIRRIWP